VRISNPFGQIGLKMLALLICLIVAGPTVFAQESGSYKNYKKLTTELKNLEKKNNIVTNLESIGKTKEGRDIWLFTVGNPKGLDLNLRPAVLVAGNIEADHVLGSEISLGVIDQLVTGYGKDAEITKALDNHVFYFLPRVNPDGAEAFFGPIKSGPKTNLTPYDGDNDGRMDEDGPEDLNGDGIITMMRVKDPTGLYCVDPKNPELLKKADPTKGEVGIYKVFWEGLDNDGDGFINEDPIGGVDINRNFTHQYPYYQSDAGIHMVSENETLAVMDWIIAQRNVSIILSFGQSDNLLTPPNSQGKLSTDRSLALVDFANKSFEDAGKVGLVSTASPYGRYGGMYSMGSRGNAQASSGRSSRPARKAATTYNKSDLVYYTKVSGKYKELTGIKKAPVLRVPKGAFSEYGYFQYGVLSLTTPGWGFPVAKNPEGEKSETKRGEGRSAGRSMAAGMGMRSGGSGDAKGAAGVDAEHLKYLKDNNIDGFVEWSAYNHSELGDVEIGGFAPNSISNPKESDMSELIEPHKDFVLYLSDLLGEVKIAKTEVINHKDGFFTIKAVVQNNGFLPTALQHGVASRSVKPTMVQLGVDPTQIVSGNPKTNFIQKLDGSGTTQSFEWLIKGKKNDELEIKLVSQKAGVDSAKIKLQ